jgi:EAL domain-containing protein (putative c-di-GMP-specific phosphodiesterase class I)
MRDNSVDRHIVKSVIDLARKFRMTVVATGVEDAETLGALSLMGCQRAQGGVVADAMPALSAVAVSRPGPPPQAAA